MAMILLGYILSAVFAVVLGIARAMQPKRTTYSVFELQRRVREQSVVALRQQEYERYRDEIAGVIWLIQAGIVAVVCLCAMTWFLPWIAFVVILTTFIISSLVVRIGMTQRIGGRLTTSLTRSMGRLMTNYPFVAKIVRGTHLAARTPMHLHSREELVDLVSRSTDVMSSQERTLIMRSLQFDNRSVEELMIPREDIISVRKKEVLGPLVISELHQTGHNRFPVIDDGLDSIVGVLHLRQLVAIHGDTKTVTAEKMMDTGVEYVRVTASLREALGAFLAHHHHLLIVLGKDGSTVGLLTIEDVIEALFGERLEHSVTKI